MGSDYGSLQNMLHGAARYEWHRPVEGEGATKLGYTDRNPYTVVRVSSSGKRCWVKADEYERTDANGISDVGQAYQFTPNPEAPEVELRWTGRRWMSNGQTYIVGKREKYHDFSF